MILEDRPVSEKTVKVKVREPFRVIHAGDTHTGGDEVSVPEHVAQEWERSRWVERVDTPPAK
jgi:hypothetical protein